MWAAGNGGRFDIDSCAADGYVQSIYTIAIGSVASDGEPAYYDERCSAKIASMFVSNSFSNISVVSYNINSFAKLLRLAGCMYSGKSI